MQHDRVRRNIDVGVIMRGVIRWGTVCLFCTIPFLVKGCGVSGSACETNDDCVDMDFCTNGACIESKCVFMPRDCSDPDPCTVDSCSGPQQACLHTPVVCPEGSCDPDTGECRCTSDSECDNADLCTLDACLDGACQHDLIVCDDPDACTVASCDPGTGECVDEPVSCQPAEVCNPATGCEPKPCEIDADCDDGVFCNGPETCDALPDLEGICQAGVAPCPAEECDEAGQTCGQGSDGGDGDTVVLEFTGTSVCGDEDNIIELSDLTEESLVVGGLGDNDDITVPRADETSLIFEVADITDPLTGSEADLRVVLLEDGSVSIMITPESGDPCSAELEPLDPC